MQPTLSSRTWPRSVSLAVTPACGRSVPWPSLGDAYGERYRRLPPLSVTALSDILAGRRLGLPSWERVVSIVLACQRHAYKTGGVTTDRGTAVLPDWLERWTTAVEAVLASSSEPPTDRDGWDRPAQLEPAHPVEEQMPDRLVPAAWLPVDPTGLHWEPGSQTVQAELVLRVLTSRGMTDLMAFDISQHRSEVRRDHRPAITGSGR
jgi:hypothetical protein